MEDIIGMLKGRWGILEVVLRHSPLKAGEIIMATACLHNFAISKGDMWVTKGRVKCLDPHDPLDNYHYWSSSDLQRQLDGKKLRDAWSEIFFLSNPLY